jgi:hypothetical protein
MKFSGLSGRRLLRKIYLVFGAGVIALLFQACYGMPMDYYTEEDCCDAKKECCDTDEYCCDK